MTEPKDPAKQGKGHTHTKLSVQLPEGHQLGEPGQKQVSDKVYLRPKDPERIRVVHANVVRAFTPGTKLLKRGNGLRAQEPVQYRTEPPPDFDEA